MNLFYEDYPCEIEINGDLYPIITDFRDYISMLDMLKDDSIRPNEKMYLILQYFPERKPEDFKQAVDALADFVTMKDLPVCGPEKEQHDEDGEPEEDDNQKNVYSFSIDYPCIIAGFLHDYGIDLQKIKYLHWWKFRMLFDNLSEDTEIRQRIHYRALDLNEVKDKEDRKRIARIKRLIQLPEEGLSDYEIADAFNF